MLERVGVYDGVSVREEEEDRVSVALPPVGERLSVGERDGEREPHTVTETVRETVTETVAHALAEDDTQTLEQPLVDGVIVGETVCVRLPDEHCVTVPHAEDEIDTLSVCETV